MNKKHILGILVLCSVFGAFASLIQVSVTGTADTTEMGYTQGESYTFNWVVNDGYTGGFSGDREEQDTFDGTMNRWFSRLVIDPWLWNTISGDGLSGVYSRPDGDYENPWDDAYAAPWDQLLVDSDGLLFRAGNFYTSGSSMGLLVNGVEVEDVIAYDLPIPFLDYSATYFVNPGAYMEDYLGAYASTGGGYLGDEGGNTIEFTTTSVTIGVVPEPSTVLLFSIGGIGAWVLRRNRIKRESE